MKRRHNVTDEEWARIKPLLPPQKKMGRPPKDIRELTDAMLWIFKTGAPWRDLPEYYGPWKTVYNNFLRWRDKGVWEHVLRNLNSEPERPWQIMVDSTIVKAHQHSAGAKKGPLIIRLLVDPGED
jgi:transposase